MFLRAVFALLLILGASAARAASWEDDTGYNAIMERQLTRAAALAGHEHLSQALAVMDGIIAESPRYGVGLERRATILIAMGLFDRARADLDQVVAMHGDSAWPFAMRATTEIEAGHADAALADLAHAATLPFRVVDYRYHATTSSFGAGRMYALRSIAEQMKGQDDRALADLQLAIRNEYPREWYLLNDYCYEAAIAGLLDPAEIACDRAIETQTRPTEAWDSRGFVHLRQHDWAKARADYDHAVDLKPDCALSLWGRGIARRSLGDTAGAAHDFAAARQNEPDVAAIMHRLGAPD